MTDGAAGWPIWSPNGNELLISRQLDDGFALGTTSTDDRSDFAELGRYDTRFLSASFWSDQGLLLFSAWDGGIMAVSRETGKVEVLEREGQAWGPEASPDSRWITYTSQLTGRNEVRIRSYPDGAVDRQLSQGGGMEPVWCRGCDELFFRNGNRWYSAAVDLGAEFPIVGTPELVYEVPGFVDTAGRSYDVSHDGQRLLLMRPVNPPDRTRVNLVHNWFGELERLVPR